MVFESVVVSVLNHFLGSYVENLDTKQLKLGIWNGDALLERLELKENAFEKLNLPIRVKGGFLDRLRLSIPWKSLFTSPVKVEVEGLYLIAAPASAFKYDAKKQAEEARNQKQNQLEKVEAAKKRDKDVIDEAEDGFVAKLITQIIKNVQVTVKNIHIRYEDNMTIPSHNFAAGLTLGGLIVQSTDSQWNIGVNQEAGSLIYKIIQLESLGVYWESDTQLVGDLPTSQWLEYLQQRIATADNTPPHINYLLRPISVGAKVVLTTKPGQKPEIPQADVKIEIEDVSLHVDKDQFQGTVLLVESLDRMSVSTRYRKYRPSVKIQNSRLWWQYAIACVVEEHIKPKLQMWSPTQISQHWKMFKEYIQLYEQKLLTASPSSKLVGQLSQLEEKLSVGNIVIARNEAENRAKKTAKGRAEKAASASGSWFSWFSSTVAEESKEIEELLPTEDELEAERKELYKAIGYAKGEALEPYTKDYVAHKLSFSLKQVTMELFKDQKRKAMLQVVQVGANVKYRPTAKGLSVGAKLRSVSITGNDGKNEPSIVMPDLKGTGDSYLAIVNFEMNPLDIAAEQSIRVVASVKPLRVTYNAATVDNVIDIFKLPKNLHLQQVSATAAQSLKELRTQTRIGLQHAISQRRVLDIDISLEAPYIILPEDGMHLSSSSVLVVDLGSLSVKSDTNVFQAPTADSLKDVSLEELSINFYDNFDVKLTDVQVIVAGKGDDWESARNKPHSPLHVLEKTGFDLRLQKSLLSNDTRLPNIVVEGKLPDLQLNISDRKIEEIAKIALSIPVPSSIVESDPNAVKFKEDVLSQRPPTFNINSLLDQTRSSPVEEVEESDDSDDFATASEGEDELDQNIALSSDTKETSKAQPLPSNTELKLKLELNRIGVSFDHWREEENGVAPRGVAALSLEISSISAEYQKQTWDDVATVVIKKVTVLSYSEDGTSKPFIESEMGDGGFVTVNYCQAKQSGPLFRSFYNSTKQSIQASSSLLKVTIHEAILPRLINIFQTMGDNIGDMVKQRQTKFGTSQTPQTQPTTTQVVKETVTAADSTTLPEGTVDLKFVGSFGGIEFAVERTTSEPLLLASLKGVSTEVKMDPRQIEVVASVFDLVLQDPNAFSNDYKKIVTKSVESEQLVKVKVIVFNDPIEGDSVNDLERANLAVEATVAQLKVIVLFQFLKNVMDFASNLQINRQLMQTARNAATEQVSRAANAIRERNTSRIRLDVTLNAPLVMIPTGTGSQDVTVINLGLLVVKNRFILGSQLMKDVDAKQLVSASGEPAIMDEILLTLSSVKVYTSEIDIVKFADCDVQVTRNLSPWCAVLPFLDVSLQMGGIKVYFTPQIFRVIMSTLESAKILTDKEPVLPVAKEVHTEVEPVDSGSTIETQEKGLGKIQVHARMSGISLLVSNDSGHLASVSLKGLSMDAVVDDSTITVAARLKAPSVSDLAHNSLFPLVLHSEENDDVVSVEMVQYRRSTQQGIDPNMSIVAKIKKMNVVFYYQFINSIMRFIEQLRLDSIQSSTPTTKGSSKALANKNVMPVRTTSIKIKLDVQIQAPRIIIPLDFLKNEGITVDLGYLGISNKLTVLPETVEMDDKVIVDTITIELSDLSVFRFACGNLLCKNLNLVHPLKMKAVVQRNLSQWYHKIPQLNVNVELKPTKAVLSDDDILMGIKVFERNLGKIYISSALKEEQLQESAEETDSAETLEQSGTTDGRPVEDPYHIVSINIFLSSIDVEIHHRVVPFKFGKIHGWKRDSNKLLAKVSVRRLKTKVKVSSNRVTNITLSMRNTCVADARSLSMDNKVTAMIQNHKMTDPLVVADKEYKMLKVRYVKDEWNRQTIDIKFNNLQVLLDVKFLHALLQFAQKSLMFESKSVDDNKKLLESSQKLPPPLVEADKYLKIDLTLSDPRIGLLEDASKADSKAIVIQSNFQVMFKLHSQGKNLSVTGQNLAMYYASYSTLSIPHKMVLKPCTLELFIDDTEVKTSGYLQISESVDLFITPAVVRTLLYILRSIPEEESTVDDGQIVPKSFWDPKPLNEDKWYFTAAETLYENKDVILESSVDPPKFQPVKKEESVVITLKQLNIVLEKEVSGELKLIPLVVFSGEELDKKYQDPPFYMEVSNWTGNMKISGSLQLKGSYFNQRLDVMEPILEPVEKEDQTYRLWSLSINVERWNDISAFLDKERDSGKQLIYPSDLPPMWSLFVSSEHVLQLTLTKTCLEIFIDLQKSYLAAAASDEEDFGEDSSMYTVAFIVKNQLGDSCTATIVPKGSIKSVTGDEAVVIYNGGSASLQYKSHDQLPADSSKQACLDVTIKGFELLKIFLSGRAEAKYYMLCPITKEEKSDVLYGFYVEIDGNQETKRVTLRSPMLIHNHLSIPCDLYSCKSAKPKKTTDLEKLGQVAGDKSFPIPLLVAHKGYVFISPKESGVSSTSEGIYWTSQDAFTLSCQPYPSHKEFFYIRVQPEPQKILSTAVSKMHKRPHHIYHLYYPVLFYNMLPVDVTAVTSDHSDKATEILSGNHLNFCHVNLSSGHKITIKINLNDCNWDSTFELSDRMDEEQNIVFRAEKEGKKLEKVISVSQSSGDFKKVYLHAKYWIGNKTGMTLQYSADGFDEPIKHPIQGDIIFFSLKKKSTEAKLKVRMAFPDEPSTTEWSKPLPLAVAGTSGTFSITHRDSRSYELGLKVMVGQSGLSELILITPLYVLTNETIHNLVIEEEGQSTKLSLAPKSTVPFWPMDVSSCKLTVSINDDTSKSKPFLIATDDTVLLRTEGKTTAVVVDVQVTDLCKIVSFKPFFNGTTPFTLLNHFAYCTVVFKQNETEITTEYSVQPGQSLSYTWDSPNAKREILWWVEGSKEKEIMQVENGKKEFALLESANAGTTGQSSSVDKKSTPSSGAVADSSSAGKKTQKSSVTRKLHKLTKKISGITKKRKHSDHVDANIGYWVSFMDGLQRVVLFTSDQYVYQISQRRSQVERVNASVTVSLVSIALSLVNDLDSREVAYLGLTGSTIIWEYEKKRGAWITLSQENVTALEKLHEKFVADETLEFPEEINADEKVDLKQMKWLAGKKSYNLRRTFYNGFWAQVTKSPHEIKLEAKIGNIQLDNQLPSPVFANVFHAVPPLDKISLKYPPKPFFEFGVVIGQTDVTGIQQYQYFGLLLQKMAFNLDLNFLFAVMDFFSGLIEQDDYTESEVNQLDLNKIEQQLQKVILSEDIGRPTYNYIGNFRIHPLSIVLSLNFSYNESDKKKYSAFGFVFNQLRSFGSAFINADDVQLRLNYFEIKNKVTTEKHLIGQIKQHYITEGIGQAYKIILGLDVLGNPVGLITGFASGTKDLFYEPFQGAVIGPEEFLQGVGMGVHDFVGATVGGVADAASKIADSVGGAAVSLVLTDEEKRKREASLRHSTIVGGLGNFASDLVGGVTNVVTKPVEGAKSGGITGFFTGAGIGVAGLFLRPIGGTFDLLNVAFDNVKRVTQRGDYAISQLRPARFIGSDGVVPIYSMHSSVGLAAFMSLDNLPDTEMYYDHLMVSQNPLKFLLVTTRRYVMIVQGSRVHGWKLDWAGVEFVDLKGKVKVDGKNVIAEVYVKESSIQGFAGIFGLSSSKQQNTKLKDIKLPTEELAKKAARLINEASEDFRDNAGGTPV